MGCLANGAVMLLNPKIGPWLQLVDTLVDGIRGWNVGITQQQMQSFTTDITLPHRMLAQCLQFRAEQKSVVNQTIVERFFANPVSGQYQDFFMTIPECKGKHTVEFIQRIFKIPLLDRGKNNLGI